MKKLLSLILAFALLAALTGCHRGAVAQEVLLGQVYDLEGVTQVDLTNAHNGKTTILTDTEAISQIAAFVGDTTGSYDGSGKGYYEGSYEVRFHLKGGETVSIGFGDSDCFYIGEGDDGYPLRYLLRDKTIAGDVVPFFAQYDGSGFAW